jgi:hypothetical protein
MKYTSPNTEKYSIELEVDSAIERLPIIIRKHPRSQRMVIRYQPLQHSVGLTLPRYVSIRQGLHFVEEKRAWLEQQIRENVRQIPLIHGQAIPMFGREYTIHHTGGRGVVALKGDNILVPGEPEFLNRRLREWLKRQTAAEINRIATIKAKTINKKYKKIIMRDTTSRWGSCSHDGNLSFSWRLVFAPFEVLEYVVSHEIAHLKHHNHSQAFWKVVELLYPDHETTQKWLRTKGTILYAYG